MHKPFVQFFFFFCCKILICQVNNSILDFELFVKTKRSKLLQQIDRLNIKGNSFYLRFYSSTLRQAFVSFHVELMRICDCTLSSTWERDNKAVI